MRLIDCFMDMIVHVVLTLQTADEARLDLNTFKAEIDRLLEESLELKEKGNFTDQDYNYARLSVCVWADEAILNSTWEHKSQWQRESLQRRYYNRADGGMAFFDRLDKIGHEDRDVREVAYYCLTLGLAGRYVEKGDNAVLDHLTASNLKRLFGSSAGEPTLEHRQLFPEAYQKQTPPPTRQKPSVKMKTLPLVIGIACIGLFFGLMAIYYFLLELDLEKITQL